MWITDSEMAKLTPIYVYGKEFDPKKPPESPVQNAHILFRRKFSLGAFTRATLRVSADDRYKVYLNGNFADVGPAPAFPFAYSCRELDVTALLREGENLLAAHTFYSGVINRVEVSGDNLHGFFCELYADGKRVLTSDETFRTARHTGYSSLGLYGYQTGFLERYDCRAPEIGFEKEDFDDSAWAFAVPNPNCTHVLTDVREPLVTARMTPAVVKQNGNVVFIDVGREICGYLTFAVQGKRGDTVVIRSGEELLEDGRVRFDGRNNCRFEEEMILSGGRDVLSQYDYKGFRYAELLLPDGAAVSDIRVLCRHAAYREAVDLTAGDKRLEEVLRLCADTLRYGVQDICFDCPTREKGQYLGDAGFIGMSHAAVTGKANVLKQVLRDVSRSSFICEGLMAVAPASYRQEIADYSLLFPYFVLWAYRFDGDKAFLREMLPAVQGVYRYFRRYENADGLLESVTEKWNLVDWPANLRDGYDFPLTQPPTPPGLHEVPTAYYLALMDAAREMCDALGEPYFCDPAHTREGFFRVFYDADAALFRDAPGSSHHSIQANILPLAFGICEEPAFVKNVLAMVREKRLTSMNYASYFVLLALDRLGEYDLLKEMIVDEGAWRRMLREGATTCFEAWGKDAKWNTSLFHPWLSFPVLFAEHIREL